MQEVTVTIQIHGGNLLYTSSPVYIASSGDAWVTESAKHSAVLAECLRALCGRVENPQCWFEYSTTW